MLYNIPRKPDNALDLCPELIETFLFAVIFGPVPICLRLIGIFPENGHPALLPILVIHTMIIVTVVIIVGIFISSMIADLVEDSERKTGRRSDYSITRAKHTENREKLNKVSLPESDFSKT
jgi:hypothetical protein